MRFGSVCSGIEAASVAWEPLGWQAAWFAEIEPFPSAVLAHHYPNTPNLGDMTDIPALLALGEVEAPDILCGGTPCQAFSVAGLRRSLDDARGNLSLTFCEIANAIDDQRRAAGAEPCIVFWENVPGVLSTKDNAFGCFLAGLAGEDVPLEPPGGKWSDAGVVLGPARAVAWRTLDAQFFGLAQRRRRVFVVASARDEFDPAAVLLEFEGVRRDSAPSREAGKGVARGAAGGAGSGVDFQNVTDRGDLCGTLMGEAQKKAGQAGHGVLAFGGNRTSGARDVASALSAHGGTGRHDFESETFITHALRGEGFDASEDGTGRGAPLVPVAMPEIAGTMKACKDSGGWSNSADHAAAGYMVPVAQPVAFHPTQDPISSAGVCHTIGANANATAAIAFSSKDCGADATADLAPTLRAMSHADSHANGGGQMAVAFDTYNQAVNAHTSQTIKSPQGAVQESVGTVLQAMQVRRLTPVECERLQGFPDHYTAIPWRGKPASECPDGPRYKALGNSWAVPVVRWIGARIECLANIV